MQGLTLRTAEARIGQRVVAEDTDPLCLCVCFLLTFRAAVARVQERGVGMRAGHARVHVENCRNKD